MHREHRSVGVTVIVLFPLKVSLDAGYPSRQLAPLTCQDADHQFRVFVRPRHFWLDCTTALLRVLTEKNTQQNTADRCMWQLSDKVGRYSLYNYKYTNIVVCMHAKRRFAQRMRAAIVAVYRHSLTPESLEVGS